MQEERLLVAQEALVAMQDMDVDGIARTEDLGRELSLEAAVEDAWRVVNLYKKLSVSALDDFPSSSLEEIIDRATDDNDVFDRAKAFRAKDGSGPRDQILVDFKNMYAGAFVVLHPYISYSMHKATDFESLEAKTREFLNNSKSDIEGIKNEIDMVKSESENVLEQVKSIAAEHGVTQQAVYFKNEADDNKTDSDRWFKYSCWVASVLVVYAVFTFFMHKISWIVPTTVFETVQLAISKVLVFGVLSYALYFCSKNYFSHKHNYVVNKHRQNALVTYESIVKAAGSDANSDIVLGLASSCIFSPQSTGYSGGSNSSNNNPSTMFMNPLVQAATNGDGIS